jgi:protein O-GlcNAc transferase
MSASHDSLAAQLQHIDAMVKSGRAKEAFVLAKALADTNTQDFACVRAAVLSAHAADDIDATVVYMRRAVALRPQDASLRLNLAKALHEHGETDEALREIGALVALHPRAAQLYTEAQQMLKDRTRYMESRSWVDRGLAACPNEAGLTFARASEYLRTGEYDKALPLYDSLIAAMPQMAFFHLERAYALNYLPDIDATRLLAAHKACGEFLDMAPDMSSLWAGRNRDEQRPLRVGFIGPDFFRHSVTYFVEGLFEHLPPERYKVFAYHTNRQRDHVTDRVERKVHAFRHVKQEQPAALAQIIARDEIDILIDLAGYTQIHGITVMAARPAPVLATYCGYPNTTGSSRVQWRIVDSLTDPPGSERFATERLLRLDPCFLCYRPEADAPDVAPLPARQKGHITFGSFNAQRKFNARVGEMWRRVLDRVPGSRLAIKSINFTEDASIAFARQQLAGMGLPIDRVDILPAANTAREHLAQYAQVDIALDTYPYHGTTTTCESLWMGAPVVTLAGDVHTSRVGVSLLTCAGMTDWIASTPDEYVDIASRAAADMRGLEHLRATLRDRVARSPLCDQAAFAARFDAALRTMWTS